MTTRQLAPNEETEPGLPQTPIDIGDVFNMIMQGQLAQATKPKQFVKVDTFEMYNWPDIIRVVVEKAQPQESPMQQCVKILASGVPVSFRLKLDNDKNPKNHTFVLLSAHSILPLPEDMSDLKITVKGIHLKTHKARLFAFDKKNDLALLRVEPDEFYKPVQFDVKRPPLITEFTYPKSSETVCSVGYLSENEPPSVIEMTIESALTSPYNLYGSTGITLNAIKPEGVETTGGPVFDRSGNLVGLSFELQRNNDILILPSILIQTFIYNVTTLASEKGTGSVLEVKPLSMNLDEQELTLSMRKYFRVKEDNGVRLKRIAPIYENLLKTGDILLKIEEFNVNKDNTITVGNNSFQYECLLQFWGPWKTSFKAKILRNESPEEEKSELKTLTVHLPLKEDQLRIKTSLCDVPEEWVSFKDFSVVPLNIRDIQESINNQVLPLKLIEEAQSGFRKYENEQSLVLKCTSLKLSEEDKNLYGDFVVDKVGTIRVRNITDLAIALYVNRPKCLLKSRDNKLILVDTQDMRPNMYDHSTRRKQTFKSLQLEKMKKCSCVPKLWKLEENGIKCKTCDATVLRFEIVQSEGVKGAYDIKWVVPADEKEKSVKAKKPNSKESGNDKRLKARLFLY